MAFRANEAMTEGTQDTLTYLVGRSIPKDQRENSKAALYDLIDEYGPVVKGYPCWHPLVACGNERQPWAHPNQCGYKGLDHTVLFRDAFLTCPYSGENAVLKSVEELNKKNGRFYIEAEALDVMLYHPEAKPIIVKCEWEKALLDDGTIPKSLAFPLLLESELPAWRYSECAETWETMHSYILGSPCGKVSSLFVNQDTGNSLKKLWNTLNQSGMFGPIRV